MDSHEYIDKGAPSGELHIHDVVCTSAGAAPIPDRMLCVHCLEEKSNILFSKGQKRCKECDKYYRNRNPEKRKAYNKKYWNENRTDLLSYLKNYQHENKKILREKANKKEKERRISDPEYRLRRNLKA